MTKAEMIELAKKHGAEGFADTVMLERDQLIALINAVIEMCADKCYCNDDGIESAYRIRELKVKDEPDVYKEMSDKFNSEGNAAIEKDLYQQAVGGQLKVKE